MSEDCAGRDKSAEVGVPLTIEVEAAETATEAQEDAVETDGLIAEVAPVTPPAKVRTSGYGRPGK